MFGKVSRDGGNLRFLGFVGSSYLGNGASRGGRSVDSLSFQLRQLSVASLMLSFEF
jgi:hypothetical protein